MGGLYQFNVSSNLTLRLRKRLRQQNCSKQAKTIINHHNVTLSSCLCYLLLLLSQFTCYCSPLQQTAAAATTSSSLLSRTPKEQLQSTVTLPVYGVAGQSLNQLTAATSKPQISNNQSDQSQLQQPKSLKFTLIAGKYWKFNIKTNSFSSHKEGELRLHKNISIGNYFIDDDNWFQYNPQTQQLFAWPNLYTKAGTYQYVLLPSSLDIEADSENLISGYDVAANIVVELIRPLYQGVNSDIDQLIDYKLSLDYLHRHSTYTLFLSQIVSVFEAILPKSSSSSSSSTNLTTTTTTTLAPQDKSSRNKFNEFLLINSSYSSEGDVFSLTWSTQPTLINNTITQISDCRLPIINDVITKLSAPNTGYLSEDDQYTIFYPLKAITTNSQAIISTERGNHSLRLDLNGPCQRPKIFEELGIILSPNKSNLHDLSSNSDFDDNKQENSNNNSLIKTLETASPNSITTTTTAASAIVISNTIISESQSTTPFRASSPSARSLLPQESSIPIQLISTPRVINYTTTTTSPIITTTTTTTTTTSSSIPTITPIATLTTIKTSSNTSINRDFAVKSTDFDSDFDVPLTESEPIKVNKTTLEAPLQKQAESSSPSPVVVVVVQKQPKIQTQAKSFEKFLDLNDALSTNSNNMQLLPTTTVATVDSPTNNIMSDTTTTKVIQNQMTTGPDLLTKDLLIVPVSSGKSNATILNANDPKESSLNEDFMGILNDVMDYMISVAVPASILIGIILILSIFIALCHLSMKKRKSKQFQVKNRFKFRYGSERRGFLKNSSKPVILEADRKSISCGGTPLHKQPQTKTNLSENNVNKNTVTYLPMQQISSTRSDDHVHVTANYAAHQ